MYILTRLTGWKEVDLHSISLLTSAGQGGRHSMRVETLIATSTPLGPP